MTDTELLLFFSSVAAEARVGMVERVMEKARVVMEKARDMARDTARDMERDMARDMERDTAALGLDVPVRFICWFVC